MGPLKKIRYNCKRATLLVERKMISGLTLRETAELSIHLYGCSVCRVFEKQSRFINIAVQQLFNRNAADNFRLDDNFKQTMQHRIEQELKKS